jgi:hypothetical protein
VRSVAINRPSVQLLLAALLPTLAGCGAAPKGTLEETFEQIYAIEPTANITVTNGDGAVFVYGSNANEVRVQAIKKAYSERSLSQIAIDISAKSDSISIVTKFPPKPSWPLFDRSGTVDYIIVVPATARISALDLNAGEVLVDGMRGPTTRARLGDGRMFAHNCFTSLDLTMRRGNLLLSYDWWESGKFSIQASIARGSALAFFPGDLVCHLVAETAHGKIENGFAASAERGTRETTKIDMLIRGGGEAAVTMHAKEGAIKIVEARP